MYVKSKQHVSVWLICIAIGYNMVYSWLCECNEPNQL